MRELLSLTCAVLVACGGGGDDGAPVDASATSPDAGAPADAGIASRATLGEIGEEYPVDDAIVFVNEEAHSWEDMDVLVVGDMDGDGLSELAIYDPAFERSVDSGSLGAVYLFYGRSDFGTEVPLASADLVIEADEPSFERPRLLAAGDLDGDGYRDLVIGDSPVLCDPGDSGTSPGLSVLYGGPERVTGARGLTGSWIPRIIPDDRCAWVPFTLASDVDLDGDGMDEIVIGSPRAPVDGGSVGAVHVIYGNAERGSGLLSEVASTTLRSDSSEVGLGLGVAGAGDIDDDGDEELLIGDVRDAATAAESLGVYFLLGQDEALPDEVIVSEVAGFMDGVHPEATFGRLDVNGDAYDDLAVGATSVAVLWGHADLDEAPWTILRAPDGFDSVVYIARCTNAGDMDGDGFSEILVAYPWANDGAGVAYVVPGPLPEDIGELPIEAHAVAFVGEPDSPSDSGLGHSASGGDDVDGDGLADLLLSKPNEGRAYLLRARGE